MGDYHYPAWGEVLGFAISLSSMLWVPGYAIYYLLSTKGSWSEVLRQGVTPVIKPRKEAVMAEEKARLNYQDVRDVELNIEADLSTTVLIIMIARNVLVKHCDLQSLHLLHLSQTGGGPALTFYPSTR